MQGGATAVAMTGKRTVNFTSGQGIVYAMEQYYHAPGKLSTMVLEGARALTKTRSTCTAVTMIFMPPWTQAGYGRDAQQAADQAVILRKANELSLNPGMNIQDGMSPRIPSALIARRKQICCANTWARRMIRLIAPPRRNAFLG